MRHYYHKKYFRDQFRSYFTGVIFLSIIFFGFFGLAESSLAATLEVGSGKTYATIQSAVDVAQVGDTVLVHAGVYNDSIQIGTSGGTYYPEDSSKYANIVLKNSGSATAKITIKSAGDGEMIIDGQSTVDYNIYGISKPYYIIEGLILRNAKQSSIRYKGSQANSLSVKNSSFEGTLSNPFDYGIESQGQGLIVSNNTFNLPGSFVNIDQSYGNNAVISQNTINGGDYGIYLHMNTDGSVIEGNLLIGNAGDLTGILFRDSNNITIRRNIIKGNYSNSLIYFQDINNVATAMSNKILNNVLHGNSSARGINNGYAWVEITNNIMYNCFVAIDSIDPTLLPQGQPGYNIIYGAQYKYYWGGNLNKDSWSYVNGTGNLLDDPLFVQAGTDYKLQPTSPAIDAGDPNTPAGTDFAGTLVPQRARADIGAYEYVSGADTTPPAAPSGLLVL